MTTKTARCSMISVSAGWGAEDHTPDLVHFANGNFPSSPLHVAFRGVATDIIVRGRLPFRTDQWWWGIRPPTALEDVAAEIFGDGNLRDGGAEKVLEGRSGWK